MDNDPLGGSKQEQHNLMMQGWGQKRTLDISLNFQGSLIKTCGIVSLCLKKNLTKMANKISSKLQ